MKDDFVSRVMENPGQVLSPLYVQREDNPTQLAAVLAAFKTLVWRYTGEPAVATEVHWEHAGGRARGEFRVTARLDDDPTVAQLLRRLGDSLRATPNDPAVDAGEWTVRLSLPPAATAPRDGADAGRFGVTVELADGQVRLAATQGTDVLSPATPPELVKGHFRMLLTGLAGDRKAAVSGLPLLTARESDTILHHWSGADQGLPPAPVELLQEFFEAQADARPAAPAVLCGQDRLTYADLERKANQLAGLLREKGAGVGTCVAMLLPRSADVYVALLGILKSGAAYVPLDAEYPSERIAFVLGDCAAQAVVTTGDFARCHNLSGRHLILLDEQAEELARRPATRPTRDQIRATARDLCYVIYTSGSTGRPKGVQIEHRNACNLVWAEEHLFAVRPDDRVYQGFSIAFDASVEEVWLAFCAGASLVAATAEMAHAGGGLSALLRDSGVTVLSCVPTLLSMMTDDVPAVRLLILGGECCPQNLLRRWYRPGRRVVNTYGPTEATVIATWGDCAADRPVTIGRPVPNYRVYILDSRLQPVPAGVTGELYLGGPGVARGYLGRGDLTAERFLHDPFSPRLDDRLYRTGDLARFTPDGEIDFAGRADTQVKLRGFRIELAEIESALMERPEVLAAVVAVREDVPGIQQLVGYVVGRGAGAIDEDAVKSRLRSRLPAFMVPSVVEQLPELPCLPSGKVDRKRLPPPSPRTQQGKPCHPPATAWESKIAAVCSRLMGGGPVSVCDDFFLDLGGHSLLAARMVSELRKDPDFRGLSVLDVYNCPTIRSLAERFETAAAEAPKTRRDASPPPAASRVSEAQYRRCGWLQAVGLYFLMGPLSLQGLAPYLVFWWMTLQGWGMLVSLAAAAGLLLGIYPLMLVVAIAVKWAVLGRIQPGCYPLWGWYYIRWWFVDRVLAAVPVDYLCGTPLAGAFLRLMGVRVGAGVYLGTDDIRAFDLVSIDDDTSISSDTSLSGYTVENGLLRIGPVTVGKRCFVGARSVLSVGSRMEDDSSLADLSLLPEGAVIRRGETHLGSPARPLPRRQALRAFPRGPLYRPRLARRVAMGLLHALGVLALPVVNLIAMFPGIALLTYLSMTLGGGWFLLAAPVAAISFVVLLCLGIAAAKWVLLGRVKPGRYRLDSWFYFRKWLVDQLIDMSLDIVGPLYSTLYLAPWYRLLGVKLGKNSEVSTAYSVSPDLLTIEDESFVADSACLGICRVDRGEIIMEPTRIGKRAFIGNSAVIPAGATVGNNSLIGVLSGLPLSKPGAAQPSTSWLGSPPVFLPHRQVNTAFDEQVTFKPTRRRQYAQRYAIEFFRVVLPPTISILLTCVLIMSVLLAIETMGWLEVVAVYPLMCAACGVAAAAFVVAAKWILMGRYKPGEQPLWSTFVWRTELLTALHEHLADPFLIEMLHGTPLVCEFFRLLGARIGSRVYMDTTALTEFDLITIGDNSSLDTDCTMQTHLFEDRVMKMSTVHVGRGCSVGAGSIVLYDTRLEDGASLGELSLVMKGETLPAGTRWEGTPARPAAPTAGPLPPATQEVLECVALPPRAPQPEPVFAMARQGGQK